MTQKFIFKFKCTSIHISNIIKYLGIYIFISKQLYRVFQNLLLFDTFSIYNTGSLNQRKNNFIFQEFFFVDVSQPLSFSLYMPYFCKSLHSLWDDYSLFTHQKMNWRYQVTWFKVIQLRFDSFSGQSHLTHIARE